MKDHKIVFRCSSGRQKQRIMKFLKRFGTSTATSGFYRLVEIAMVEEIHTNQIEKRIREQVLENLEKN